jgi:hypothetical protein
VRANRASSGSRIDPLAALIGVCSLALLAPLFGPALAGRVFVYNDLSWFHLPIRHLYQQALQSGDSVLWTPSIFAGLYLHGEGQGGLFHPFHQILYRLLPLGAAFNLELIANYPAAFAGMCWLLRRLRFGWAAALFGALLFAFSGFNLLHHHHVNLVAVVAHMPWLLAAADVLIAEDRRRTRTLAFAAIALVLGSEVLLGFPQAVWWNMVTLVPFALFRAGQLRQWRRLMPCAAAVAIGVLLGGIQLLPTADFAAQSTRVSLSGEFALTYSMHPYNLFQVWSPYFFARGAYSERDFMWFHDFGVYSGAILPVALIWTWIRRDALPGRRTLSTAVTAFAAVMLILALGRYGGIAWLLTHVPLLQSLRAPVRYVLLVQFALAILAAITMEDLLAIADGRSAPPSGSIALLWVPATLGVITTLTLNTGLLPYGRHTFAAASAAAAGVAIVAAVTLLVYLGARGRRWAIAALVVLTAIDLGAWGIRFIYREPARSIEELTEHVPPPPDDPAESYASAPERGPYRPNILVLRGYRLTSGYAGLFPATQHPIESDVARRLAGTRWTFAQDGRRQPAEGWAERVRLVGEDGRESGGSARLAVDRPGQLVADVDAPGRRILAFTERFHSGWSATVDGVPLPMVRVEGDFLGCVVNGGAQRVVIQFMPRSFVYGSIASAIGAVLLAGVLIFRRA